MMPNGGVDLGKCTDVAHGAANGCAAIVILDSVLAYAQFLCTAHQLSESQILTANLAERVLAAIETTVYNLKTFRAAAAWHKA